MVGGTRSPLDTPLWRALEDFTKEIEPGARIAPIACPGFTDSHYLRASFGTVALMFGRFAPVLAALALAGSLAGKKVAPVSAGTFRTDGPTFVVLLVGVIMLTAGLMIFPALTLGPIVEGLSH